MGTQGRGEPLMDEKVRNVPGFERNVTSPGRGTIYTASRTGGPPGVFLSFLRRLDPAPHRVEVERPPRGVRGQCRGGGGGSGLRRDDDNRRDRRTRQRRLRLSPPARAGLRGRDRGSPRGRRG